MNNQSRQNEKYVQAFTLVELLLVVFIAGILMRTSSPSAMEWLRRQQLKSYSNEMKEFIRLVRSEARRWNTTCKIMSSEPDTKKSPLKVNCIFDEKSVSNIHMLQPTIPRHSFYLLNRSFSVNPRGRIVGSTPVIFIFGYSVNGVEKINSIRCLTIDHTNSYAQEGNYYFNDQELIVIDPTYAPNLKKNMCRQKSID